MTSREGTRETLGKGTHICTLDVGRARMVRDGIRGAGSEASMAGVNSEGRDFINMHGSPWCPSCPELGRAQEAEGSAWEGGVKGARLVFRRCLVALFSLLLASLSCAGFV